MKAGFLIIILLVFIFLFSVAITLRLKLMQNLFEIVRIREKRIMLSTSLKSCQQALSYFWFKTPINSFEITLNGYHIICRLDSFSSTEATYTYHALQGDTKLSGRIKIRRKSSKDDKK